MDFLRRLIGRKAKEEQSLPAAVSPPIVSQAPQFDLAERVTGGISRLIGGHEKSFAAAIRQRRNHRVSDAGDMALLHDWLRAGKRPFAVYRQQEDTQPGLLAFWIETIVKQDVYDVAYLPLHPEFGTARVEVMLPALAARLAYLQDGVVPLVADGRAAREAIRSLMAATPARPLLIVLERIDYTDLDIAPLPVPLPANVFALVSATSEPAAVAKALGWPATATALIGWDGDGRDSDVADPPATVTAPPPAPAREAAPAAPVPELMPPDIPPPPDLPPAPPLQVPVSKYVSPPVDVDLREALPRLLRQARLTDQSRSYSPRLLALAVGEGFLAPDDAIDLARNQPKPALRAESCRRLWQTAVTGTVPDDWSQLPDLAQAAAREISTLAQRARELAALPAEMGKAEALQVAHSIRDLVERTHVLADLTAWPEVMETIGVIGSQWERSRLLAELAAELPAIHHEQAVEMSMALDENGRYLADALCALVPHLSDDAITVLCQRVGGVADRFGQVTVAACLAARLDGEAQAQWVERWRQQAAVEAYPMSRIQLMVCFLPYLPPEQQQPLLEDLWRRTNEIDRPDFRAEMMGLIALHFPEAQRAARLAEADKVLATVKDAFTRDRLWGSWGRILCSRPGTASVEAGLDLFAQINNEYLCTAHLQEIAPRLASVAPDRIVARIRELLPTPTNRAVFWSDQIAHFPTSSYAAIYADLQQMEERGARRIGLVALAPFLPERRRIVQRLVQETRQPVEHSSLPVLLAALARQLPSQRTVLLRRAMKEAAARDGANRAYLLGDLVAQLQEATPPALRDAAVTAVAATAEQTQMLVWPTLLANLAVEYRPSVAKQALELLLAARSSIQQELRLVEIIPYLDGDGLAAVVANMNELADSMRWPALIRALAPHLDAALLDKVLVKLLNLPPVRMSVLAQGLVILLPHLDDDQREMARLAAAEIKFPAPRIQVLAALAALENDQAALEQLLTEAKKITVETSRVQAQANIACYLDEPMRTAVVRRALAVAAGMVDEHQRRYVLQSLMSLTTPALTDDMVFQATRIADEAQRRQLLTSLIPQLPSGKVGALLPLVSEFGEVYDHDPLLAELVPHLPPELLVEALLLVRTRAHQGNSPAALRAIVDRWADMEAQPMVDNRTELLLTLEAYARSGSSALLAALTTLLPVLAQDEVLLRDLAGQVLANLE